MKAAVRLGLALAMMAALFTGCGSSSPVAEQVDFSCTTNNDTITIGLYTGTGTVVIIPCKINGLSVRDIGEGAFITCNHPTGCVITDVRIPSSVTNIGELAFAFCNGLTNITIPDSVIAIKRRAFDDCLSLTTIALPASVVNIGDQAFGGCISLTNLVIPSGVVHIGNSAFSNCESLTGIYFKGNAPSLDKDAFVGATNATIYYLEGTKGWGKEFGGRPTAVWKTDGETNGTVVSTNKDMTIDLGDGVKIEMGWIPPGDFLMGSPTNGFGRSPYDTQHKVTLTKGFWMGKHEVTQEQWEKVMGRTPSSFKGAKNPVETVSWNDTQDFIKKLNGIVQGGVFRLPTEAEWEYACRAGTKTRFNTGDNDRDLAKAGWYSANSDSKTHPVGEKKANAFGLYDMHGNVWEWCQDWYGTYPSGEASDPTGPSSGSYRVSRGGSWGGIPAFCRSAYRVGRDPTRTDDLSGFRVVLVR